MSDVWKLFPYPTIANGRLTDGALLDAHPDCRSCPSRECTVDDSGVSGEAEICRFGLTYARVDDGRVVAGVVATDHPNATAKAKQRIRLERSRQVSRSGLGRAVKAARELGPGVVDSFAANRAAALAIVKEDPEMQRSVAAQLRRDAEDDLNQSHDFMQMVKLVKGYAEALLRVKFPDLPPEEAAEQLQNEGAIYFATQLMVMKMDSLQYLNEMNRARGSESTFGIHPLVLKYKRIYDWTAGQKYLKIHLGPTRRSAYYNGHAIGTLVQALLDNMVKYAPPRSEAAINFVEDVGAVTLEFESLGPRIERDELKGIFMPKVRGKAARKEESTGQGIGLGSAKQISDALQLELSCSQDDIESSKFPGRYLTTFRFRLATTS
jgi:K+-sensing histidine kinase KdpD